VELLGFKQLKQSPRSMRLSAWIPIGITAGTIAKAIDPAVHSRGAFGMLVLSSTTNPCQ
jgi:hypothetical protein